MSLFKYISSFLISNENESIPPTQIEAKYIENIDMKNQYDTIQLTIKTGDCVLIFNIDVLNSKLEEAVTYLENLLDDIHCQSVKSDESMFDTDNTKYIVNCEGNLTCFFRQHIRVSFDTKNDLILSATYENRCGCDFSVKISRESFFEQMYSVINKMESKII